MTEQEIITGNVAIAEFMGGEQFGNGGSIGSMWRFLDGDFDDEDLKYHTSWDWIMPVVEKIESLFDGSLTVFIKDKRCHIEMGTQYAITTKGQDIDIPECYTGFCSSKI